MSSIHEALQRAYLERGKSPFPVDDQVDGPQAATIIEEPLVAKPVVDIDIVARHPWQPITASLPTLGDRGACVEQFRSLRSHVYQARYEAPLKTILVASGLPEEGKSFVAANLAMSLARNSVNNILLIDGDLRRPTLHTLLGAPNQRGLANYLEGTAELIEIMQRGAGGENGDGAGDGSIPNLTFIPSGKCSDNSSELVAGPRMGELIEAVSPNFDWIVIDAPPVLAVTDAIEMARVSDAVLLVARGASTPYDSAVRAQAAFKNSRVLGFVLNNVADAPRSGNYYNYYGTPETNGHAK
jgi:protein-tyrosine kinase